jgi:hypothetical protein
MVAGRRSQDTFIQKAGGSEIIGQMWAFPDKKGRACYLIAGGDSSIPGAV